MNILLDQYKVNKMVNAIMEVMRPHGQKESHLADYLFMGGPWPTNGQAEALAYYALDNDYDVIFPSFDPANLAVGPIGFHVIITDGKTEATSMPRGRLWKRDRLSTAILVFEDPGVTVRINAKGALNVRSIKTSHHAHGYDLALEAVIAKAARESAAVPVVSSIGTLQTVMDLRTLGAAMAMA